MGKSKEITDDYELTAGIHTFCIKTEDTINKEYMFPDGVIKTSSSVLENKKTKIIINANKMSGFLYTYSDFVSTLAEILDELQIKNYDLIRTDMCFDSYDSAHYQKYAKLNRLIISMIGHAYSVKNKYKTNDLFTNKQLSVAIKNPNSFEVENYDKEYESGGRDIAKSRFEIRSTRMNPKTIEEEFILNWDRRFKKSLSCFDETLDRYNFELKNIYCEEKSKNPNMKWSTFFQMYQNCIFTKEQAINLLNLLGEESAEDKYKYFKKKYHLETYTKADIFAEINEIKRARDEYFMG